jgi:hypothetical protein
VTPVATSIEGPEISPFTALSVTRVPAVFPLFASGLAIEGALTYWTSDAPSIVEALVTGGLVSRNNGTAIVTASSLGATRDYVVVVRQVPVVLTGVGPADTTVAAGATFRARPFGQDGSGHALRPGAAVFWSSTGSVTVNGDGLVTASSTGAGSVTATHGPASHTLQVTVVP